MVTLVVDVMECIDGVMLLIALVGLIDVTTGTLECIDWVMILIVLVGLIIDVTTDTVIGSVVNVGVTGTSRSIL